MEFEDRQKCIERKLIDGDYDLQEIHEDNAQDIFDFLDDDEISLKDVYHFIEVWTDLEYEHEIEGQRVLMESLHNLSKEQPE